MNDLGLMGNSDNRLGKKKPQMRLGRKPRSAQGD
jgi:hypothetical protein